MTQREQRPRSPSMDLERLTTEERNPRSLDMDRMSTREFLQLMNQEDAGVAGAVAAVLDSITDAVDRIAERMRAGGRLIYTGAGTSGRLGVLDAAECPPTFNAEPGQVVGLIAGGESALLRAVEGAEDDPKQGAFDVRAIGVTAGDAVMGIAASGRTPYVLGALDAARAAGALTIGFSCTEAAEICAHADICIVPVVGAEVLTGSTRLKAGTATKMVLNMISTGVMVRLGKTYGNLMVDLQATNQKLVQRAIRIVTDICTCSRDEAKAALDACDGEVKTAVLARSLGLKPDEARKLLAAHGGHLRAALAKRAEGS